VEIQHGGTSYVCLMIDLQRQLSHGYRQEERGDRTTKVDMELSYGINVQLSLPADHAKDNYLLANGPSHGGYN